MALLTTVAAAAPVATEPNKNVVDQYDEKIEEFTWTKQIRQLPGRASADNHYFYLDANDKEVWARSIPDACKKNEYRRGAPAPGEPQAARAPRARPGQGARYERDRRYREGGAYGRRRERGREVVAARPRAAYDGDDVPAGPIADPVIEGGETARPDITARDEPRPNQEENEGGGGNVAELDDADDVPASPIADPGADPVTVTTVAVPAVGPIAGPVVVAVTVPAASPVADPAAAAWDAVDLTTVKEEEEKLASAKTDREASLRVLKRLADAPADGTEEDTLAHAAAKIDACKKDLDDLIAAHQDLGQRKEAVNNQSELVDLERKAYELQQARERMEKVDKDEPLLAPLLARETEVKQMRKDKRLRRA